MIALSPRARVPATPPVGPTPTDSGFAARRGAFYRHDLDGLRGVAIMLVAIYHIWFGRVSGGVDVFLALSGFFFGGKVLRAALDRSGRGVLSPAREFVRLARRLLPALVVVLAASAALTFLVQPKTRWETFADQSLASLGYYQNWELSRTAADYLQAGEAVSPLQHIWSMSVQGQFFLAFLLAIYALGLLGRRFLGRHLRTGFIAVIATACAASFTYAVLAHQADQASAYYNSFARAWELLLGVLAGALIPHIRWPRWVRATVAAVALAAILGCGAVINGVREFPGPWALVPIGATVLLVLAGANRHAHPSTAERLGWPSRMLAARPLVTLGAMAYSLYLWHWPLLIFWLVYTGQRGAGPVAGSAILAVSLALAYLTSKFIEDPLRYRSPAGVGTGTGPTPVLTVSFHPHGPAGLGDLRRWRRPTTALGTVVALLGVALTATSFTWREHVTVGQADRQELVVLSTDDYPGARALLEGLSVPKARMRPTILEAKRDLPASTQDGCISNFSNPALINCAYGDTEADRTVALAGGSHAEHWLPALDLLGREHHFKVVTYLKYGCPLSTEPDPLIVGNNQPYPQCRTWVHKVMNKLVEDGPDYVFSTSTRPFHTEPGDTTPATYLGVWKTLSEHDIPVLAVRDTPWLVRDGFPLQPADCLAAGGDPESCGIKRSEVLAKRNPTLQYTKRFPLLKPLDMSDAICDVDVCRAVEGNILIYHDAHHLSPTYVRTMTAELGRQMAAATGWW